MPMKLGSLGIRTMRADQMHATASALLLAVALASLDPTVVINWNGTFSDERRIWFICLPTLCLPSQRRS